MSDKELSIIIPNYNSGNLLRRCIKSIISDNELRYISYEVIIIDDGSSDNSIDGIVGKNIKIIKQENRGVAAARNKGIIESSGKYIMFVDADDSLLKNGGSIIRKGLAQQVDLVVFNYAKGNSLIKINQENREKVAGNPLTNLKKKMIKAPTAYMTVWGKLFRAYTIKENKIYFDEKMRLAEDGDFMVNFLLNTQVLSFEAGAFYKYEDNPLSTMRKFDDKTKDYLTSLRRTEERIKDNKELMDAYNFYILMHLNLMMVHETFAIENQESYLTKRKQLKELLNVDIIKKAINNIGISQCTSMRTFPIILLKLKLYDIAGLAFILRSIQNHKKVSK